MSLLLRQAFVTFFPFILGYCLLSPFFPQKAGNQPLRLAISFGTGTGLITLWMFGLCLAGVPLSAAAVDIPLGILAAGIVFIKARNQTSRPSILPNIPAPGRKFDGAAFVCSIYIALLTCYVFWRALSIPYYTFDTISTHAFNAKVLFYERSLQYFNTMPHNTYPLHIPLLECWIALNLNAWDDLMTKLPFPIYYLSLLIILHAFVKKHTSRRWAVFAIALLVSAPFFLLHATIGYRDFTLAYYNTTVIILLLLWHKERTAPLFWAASFFAGMCSFTKVEGVGYLLVHTGLLIFLLMKEKDRRLTARVKNFAAWIFPAYLICFSFYVYKFTSLTSEMISKTKDLRHFDLYSLQLQINPQILHRIEIVISKIASNIFASNNWNMVWFLLVVSLLRRHQGTRLLETKVLLFLLTAFLGLYLCAYTFTQHFYWIAETETVVSRSLLHFFPIVPVLIALLNNPPEESRQ